MLFKIKVNGTTMESVQLVLALFLLALSFIVAEVAACNPAECKQEYGATGVCVKGWGCVDSIDL